MPEESTNQDPLWQHKALGSTALFALALNQVLKAALTAAQLAELDASIRAGKAKVAISVVHDGESLSVSVAAVAADAGEAFDAPILRLWGSFDAALAGVATPGDVPVRDLRKLN
jgi:hypothetical protein